jgi:excisionase family DNA binding protein
MDQAAVGKRLDALAERMRADGHVELADELARLAAEVRASNATWTGDLLTPMEAAQALGVSSVNTIKRWAREGKLEGYHIGGRVLVTRRSVECFQQAPALQRQQAFERDLEEALTPFAGTAEEVAELTSEVPGRTPWRVNAATTA